MVLTSIPAAKRSQECPAWIAWKSHKSGFRSSCAMHVFNVFLAVTGWIGILSRNTKNSSILDLLHGLICMKSCANLNGQKRGSQIGPPEPVILIICGLESVQCVFDVRRRKSIFVLFSPMWMSQDLTGWSPVVSLPILNIP